MKMCIHLLLRLSGRIECCLRLLDILSEEGRLADYWYVLNKADGALGIDARYYCDAMRLLPDKTEEILGRHPELRYYDDSLKILTEYYSETGNNEEYLICKQRLKQQTAPNMLEKALLAGELKTAPELAQSDFEGKEDYSESQLEDIISNINDITMRENYKCRDAFTLYEVQGNHRGLAEKLLWEKTFTAERDDALTVLAEILFNENCIWSLSKS